MFKIILYNYSIMEKYKSKYMEAFKSIYPECSEEELEEIIELTISFWQWLIENLDLFFND